MLFQRLYEDEFAGASRLRCQDSGQPLVVEPSGDDVSKGDGGSAARKHAGLRVAVEETEAHSS